jgi:hypothetical protein
MIDNRPLPEIATEDLSFLKKGAIAVGLAALVYLISKLFGGGSSGGGGGGGGGGGSSKVPAPNTISKKITEIVKSVGDIGKEMSSYNVKVNLTDDVDGDAQDFIVKAATAAGASADTIDKLSKPGDGPWLTWMMDYFFADPAGEIMPNYGDDLLYHALGKLHVDLMNPAPAGQKLRDGLQKVFTELVKTAKERLDAEANIARLLENWDEHKDAEIKTILDKLPITDVSAMLTALGHGGSAGDARSTTVASDYSSLIMANLTPLPRPESNKGGAMDELTAAFGNIEVLWKDVCLVSETLVDFAKANAGGSKTATGKPSASQHSDLIRDNHNVLMQYTHLTSKLHTFFEGNQGVTQFVARLAHLMRTMFKTRHTLAELAYRADPCEVTTNLRNNAKTMLLGYEKLMKDDGYL